MKNVNVSFSVMKKKKISSHLAVPSFWKPGKNVSFVRAASIVHFLQLL